MLYRITNIKPNGIDCEEEFLCCLSNHSSCVNEVNALVVVSRPHHGRVYFAAAPTPATASPFTRAHFHFKRRTQHAWQQPFIFFVKNILRDGEGASTRLHGNHHHETGVSPIRSIQHLGATPGKIHPLFSLNKWIRNV